MQNLKKLTLAPFLSPDLNSNTKSIESMIQAYLMRSSIGRSDIFFLRNDRQLGIFSIKDALMRLSIEKLKILITSAYHPGFAVGWHMNTIDGDCTLSFTFGGWQRFELVIFTQQFNLKKYYWLESSIKSNEGVQVKTDPQMMIITQKWDFFGIVFQIVFWGNLASVLIWKCRKISDFSSASRNLNYRERTNVSAFIMKMGTTF